MHSVSFEFCFYNANKLINLDKLCVSFPFELILDPALTSLNNSVNLFMMLSKVSLKNPGAIF